MSRQEREKRLADANARIEEIALQLAMTAKGVRQAGHSAEATKLETISTELGTSENFDVFKKDVLNVYGEELPEYRIHEIEAALIDASKQPWSNTAILDSFARQIHHVRDEQVGDRRQDLLGVV